MILSEQKKFFSAFPVLWRIIGRRRRVQFFAVLATMIAASVAEVFSLGMVVPFLAVLVDPSSISSIPIIKGFAANATAESLVLWAGAAFCVATAVSASVRLLVLYVTTKFTFVLGADISLQVYRRALYQPYAVHISRNSSEVINGVVGKANAVSSNVLGQLLVISSALLFSIAILAALLVVNLSITVVAVFGFTVIYGTIAWATRRAVARDSMIVAREGPRVYRALQEGLGGIRDVIIDGTEETFINLYRVSDRKVRHAQGRILIAAGSPRFLVESLGIILIVILAIVAKANGASAGAIAILGALALGAQRLLPMIQQAYAAAIAIRGSEALLWDVLDILDQPVQGLQTGSTPTLTFANEIRLCDVTFAYVNGDTDVLRDVSIRIPRGARVGIFGPTGGGKSTLLDILMGLLQPTGGRMLVDAIEVDATRRRAWQQHIAHVPQSIFLSDVSVAENIAFGRPLDLIDHDRVRHAAELAQLAETIEKLPNGYSTSVGERGVRLSGGQRQRIGVARALYKSADLVIFDEATSALDNETEREVMAAIDGLNANVTIIMVAHRLTTLTGCDMLLEVKDGRVRDASAESLQT